MRTIHEAGQVYGRFYEIDAPVDARLFVSFSQPLPTSASSCVVFVMDNGHTPMNLASAEDIPAYKDALASMSRVNDGRERVTRLRSVLLLIKTVLGGAYSLRADRKYIRQRACTICASPSLCKVGFYGVVVRL